MEIIIAASKNKGKIKEMEAIAEEFGMRIIPMDEAGLPDIDVIEDGETFEDNSLKKAKEIMKLCGIATIADDSGLEVDFLGGAPGVFSARYAGEDRDDGKNRKKLLEMMRDAPPKDRTGRFVSVVSLVYPDGREITARGVCEGHITFEEKGENGFGYDALFVPLGYERTFAELPPSMKNRMSHRANALELLRIKLEN